MRSTCSLPLIIGLVFHAKSDIKIMATFLAGWVVAFAGDAAGIRQLGAD